MISSFILGIIGLFLLILGILGGAKEVRLAGNLWPPIFITWFGAVSMMISFYLLLINIFPFL